MGLLFLLNRRVEPVACLLFYLVMKIEVLAWNIKKKTYQIWPTAVKAFKKDQNAPTKTHIKSKVLLRRFLDEHT